MANRKGVFIGAYVPNHLKESLRRRAAAEHRTLSQEITRIRDCLQEALIGVPKNRNHAAARRIRHPDAGPMMRRTPRAETGRETKRADLN